MLLIRTAEELARALDSPLQHALKEVLAAHRERLSECEGYDLSELAEFAIVEPGDTLQDLASIIEVEVGEGGAAAAQFSRIPEYVEQHATVIELVFILSDTGFGLVLLISSADTIDPAIRALAMSYIGEPAAN